MVLLLISLETFLLIVLIILYLLAFPWMIAHVAQEQGRWMIAHVAQEQGRNGVSWFFLSLLFSPFFIILVLIALGDTNNKRNQRAIEDELARNSVHSKHTSKPPDNGSLQQLLEQSRHS